MIIRRRSTAPIDCVYTLASRRAYGRESCVEQLQRLKATEHRTHEEQQRLDLIKDSCCIPRALKGGRL